MVIATGVAKRLTFKKQSAKGTPATGASAQELRRTESTISLGKATYQSAEILTSQQRRDMRHGVRSVTGSIKGELSVGTYQKFFEAVLRQAVQTAPTTGAQTNITAAVTTAPAGTFTRAAGSFLTDGFKIGDVVNWTGWATTGTNNNNNHMLIMALTATVMTCWPLNGQAVAAKTAGDSVTCVLVGKKTWMPASGHTRDYFSIEHWFADISQSELFTDCVIGGANVALPSTGMSTVDFPIMGIDMTPAQAASHTSPSALSTGGILAAANGAMIVNGTRYATITDLTINITGNYTAPGGVVGSNVDPDIFPGVLEVTGSLTAFFEDATLRDLFTTETEFMIAAAMTATSANNTPFTAFVMSRCKATDFTKDDGTAGLKITMPFTALENTGGGAAVANLQTTISIQDSAFA